MSGSAIDGDLEPGLADDPLHQSYRQVFRFQDLGALVDCLEPPAAGQ